MSKECCAEADGLLLGARFLLENSHAGELVFHLVECLEDGRAVAGGLCLVGVAGLVGEGVALAGVEEEFALLARPSSTGRWDPESRYRG